MSLQIIRSGHVQPIMKKHKKVVVLPFIGAEKFGLRANIVVGFYFPKDKHSRSARTVSTPSVLQAWHCFCLLHRLKRINKNSLEICMNAVSSQPKKASPANIAHLIGQFGNLNKFYTERDMIIDSEPSQREYHSLLHKMHNADVFFYIEHVKNDIARSNLKLSTAVQRILDKQAEKKPLPMRFKKKPKSTDKKISTYLAKLFD